MSTYGNLVRWRIKLALILAFLGAIAAMIYGGIVTIDRHLDCVRDGDKKCSPSEPDQSGR